MTFLRGTMVVVLLALALGAAQAATAVSNGAVCKPGDPCGPPPRYSCTKTTQPITVDGRLDEAAWSRAVVFRDFHLTDGVQRPTFRTEFRALWDDQNLYLAYVCSDPKIVAKRTKRDEYVWEDDCVEAFLSSGHEVGRYYEFEVNPRNTQFDTTVVVTPDDKREANYDWNCAGLRSAVRVEGEGAKQKWTVEIALPFSEIGREKKAPSIGETWRANFYRIEYGSKKEEDSCWSPTLRLDFHTPDRFGYLVFAGVKGR